MSKEKKLGILSSILLVLALVSVIIPPVPVLASPYPYNPTDTEVASALDYLRSGQTTDGDIDGFSTSAWVTMAIAAAGEDPHDWKVRNNPSIVDYLANNADDASSATDYARMILAIVAADEDPASFGGVNFVTLLKGQYDDTQIGDASLLNDDFWGVMALISAGESPSSEIVAKSVAFIKSNQNATDHGWSWGVGGDSDVDDTAAAIMALIAAGESSSSDVVTKGLAFIKSTQVNSGGFVSPGSWGADNADTDSWAIDAIVAAEQEPTSDNWTKSGKNPIDDLFTFQQGDGSFYWQSGNPGMSVPKTTASAILALLGKPYPVKILQARWSFWAIEYPAALLKVCPGDTTVNLDTITGVPPEILGVFGETAGVWKWFIPGWTPAENTLHELVSGRPYMVQLSGACTWVIAGE